MSIFIYSMYYKIQLINARIARPGRIGGHKHFIIATRPDFERSAEQIGFRTRQFDFADHSSVLFQRRPNLHLIGVPQSPAFDQATAHHHNVRAYFQGLSLQFGQWDILVCPGSENIHNKPGNL